MNIGVDESGSFVYTPSEDSWNCVAAYAYPESNTRSLRDEVRRLVRLYARPGVREVKLRDLAERDYVALLERLRSLDGVLFAVATNAAMNSPALVLRHQHEQAKMIVAHVDKMLYETGKEALHRLARRVEQLAPQLYVQMIAQVQLVFRIMQYGVLYFVQRHPQTLGKFRWRIDQKASTRTEYERAYTELLPGLLQTASFREPMPMLRGANYRWFERLYYAKGEAPTYLRDVYGIALDDDDERSLNLGQFVGEDVRFVDSRDDTGVQIADLLASGLRRCLRKQFVDNERVAASLGELMVQGKGQDPPIELISLGGAETVFVGEEVVRILSEMRRHARAMLRRDGN